MVDLASIDAAGRSLATSERTADTHRLAFAAVGQLRRGDAAGARAYAAMARALARGWLEQVVALCDAVDREAGGPDA